MIGGSARRSYVRGQRTGGATMGATARSFPSASASAPSARLLSSLPTTNGQLVRSHPMISPLHARNEHENDTFSHGFYMVSTRFLHGFPCPKSTQLLAPPALTDPRKTCFCKHRRRTHHFPPCLCASMPLAALPNEPTARSASSCFMFSCFTSSVASRRNEPKSAIRAFHSCPFAPFVAVSSSKRPPTLHRILPLCPVPPCLRALPRITKRTHHPRSSASICGSNHPPIQPPPPHVLRHRL